MIDAEDALAVANLTLGHSPRPSSVDAKITSQVPRAGEYARAGTPVNVFIRAPAS